MTVQSVSNVPAENFRDFPDFTDCRDRSWQIGLMIDMKQRPAIDQLGFFVSPHAAQTESF